MHFFPELLLLSFLLWLPLLASFPVVVKPHRTLAHFLHFSHDLHHRNTDDHMNLSKFTVRPGLNGDPCESEADCKGDRLCVPMAEGYDIPERCQPETFFCVCLKLNASCAAGSDCDDGEVCFDTVESVVNICVSEQTALNMNGTVVDDQNPGDTVPTPAENESENDAAAPVEDGSGANVQGLNGDPCSSAADCQGDRICMFGTASSVPERCTPDASECFCFSLDAACLSISDCDPGEVCFDFPDKAVNICVSKQYAAKLNEDLQSNAPASAETEPTPSDTDECDSTADCEAGEECVDVAGSLKCMPSETEAEDESSTVCIAAHHLSELNPHEMLYPKHVLARVLCDKHNNCGTPGHIVKYKGKPMMMSSYCGIEPCSERITEVNSPKYVRRKLVASNSDDLVFTALAARYNSRIEEAMLSLACRMGL